MDSPAQTEGAWQVKPCSFTQCVADAMRKLYPEELADSSWDNVGLLLGNTETSGGSHKVMVTNDLTYQVAVDAIEKHVAVIVSYHPFIFSGLKSITVADSQQATLLLLAKANIAVYSPHTAVDAAPEGLNTWLADIVDGPYPSNRCFAVPCYKAPASHAPAGYGVVGRWEKPQSLASILKRLAEKLGGLQYVMVASPVGVAIQDTRPRSFAVCAGSGFDVLKNADVELLVTGEASHHSALKVIQQGKTLVQVFHSNSERAYLQDILRTKLERELQSMVPKASVICSAYDNDPFRIVDIGSLE